VKIALIGNEYEQQFPLLGYGGIETCVENLAKGLAANKNDFFVVCPKREIKLDFNFEILETKEPPAKITQRNPSYFAAEAKKLLKDLKPDVIWSQSNWSTDALQDLKIPIICTFHDSCEKKFGWVRNYDNVKYRFISKFQYSLWVKEDWEKRKSFICYTGLNDEDFDLELESENYYLWCAGLKWGMKAKGLDIFLKLAELNRDKQFRIYGSGDKEIEDHLISVQSKSDNILYKGELKRGAEHKQAFSKAKFFIMPSQIPEAFGRTTIEAMSKGTPVISTANGASPELIQDGGFSSNDLEELNKFLNSYKDRRSVFEYSKKFHVKEEIKTLIENSNF
jgi:glycosyltransferase involved in cell wall biosynthesis